MADPASGSAGGAGDVAPAGGAGDVAPAGGAPNAAAAGLPDEERYPFDFERARRGTYRSYEAARPGVVTLLGRLGVAQPERALERDGAVGRRLLVFGAESLLNVTWYEQRAQREFRNQRIMSGCVYGLAVLFVAGTIYLLIENPKVAEAGMSQIAALVGALLAGFKFLTSAWDFQKSRGSFWQAAADLKERLYHFITDWYGKAWDESASRFGPEFVVALQEEIRKAREIQSEERERFYALMAAPSKIIESTGQLTGDLQTRVGAYMQADQTRRDKLRTVAMEEMRKQQAVLEEMYPDKNTRPAPIADRVNELKANLQRMQRVAAAGTAPANTLPAATSLPLAAAGGDLLTDLNSGGGSPFGGP